MRLEQHQDETFTDQRIELHGRLFHGCRFERCELVFDGDRPPSFRDNEFVDSTFVFTDAAVRTLYMLSTLYHAGDGGREIVERCFEDIREHRLRGKEIRTVAPTTDDHSLH